MLVEMKNGETYDGHLVNCGTWMNIYLREVIRTSKDGQVLASAPDEIGSQLVGRGREEIGAGPFKGIGPGQEDGSKGMGSSRGRGGSGSKGGRSRGGGRGHG